MSCGLFDLLPDDIIKVLWNAFEPKALAKAAVINRKFLSRSNNENLWRQHAECLLGFNTIMTREQAHEILQFPGSRDFCSYVVKKQLQKRYKQLEASSSNAPVRVDEFLSTLTFEGFLHPRWLTPNTWKQLYSALVVLLNPIFRKRPGMSSIVVDLLIDYIKVSDPRKSDAALKALCTLPLDSFQYKLSDLDEPASGSTWTRLLLEKMYFEESTWRPTTMAPCLCCFSDPIALYLILQEEFSPFDREREGLISDGTMLQSTHQYITERLGGVERAFSALVELLELADLFQTSRMSFVDKLIKLARTDSDPRVTDIVCSFSLLLIHLYGFGDRIISDLLDPCDSQIYDLTLLKTIRANSMPGAAKRKLFGVLNDAKNSARSLLRAAWLLHHMGSSVKSMELEKRGIQGYPYPWNGPVPVPPELRRCILNFYRENLLPVTKIPIFLEAHSIVAEKYEDYEKIDPTSIDFEGVKILGPYSAAESHGEGWGTYNIYKVYISNEGTLLGNDAGKSISIAVLFTCCYGPYACVRRNDVNIRPNVTSATLFVEGDADRSAYSDIYAPGKRLPSWEKADQALRKFATQYGWSLLEMNLLDQRFHGLHIDYYGSREVSLYDLLFNFQD